MAGDGNKDFGNGRNRAFHFFSQSRFGEFEDIEAFSNGYRGSLWTIHIATGLSGLLKLRDGNTDATLEEPRPRIP